MPNKEKMRSKIKAIKTDWNMVTKQKHILELNRENNNKKKKKEEKNQRKQNKMKTQQREPTETTGLLINLCNNYLVPP